MELAFSSTSTRPSRARITRGHIGAARWEIAAWSPAPRLRPYVRELSGYVEETPGPLRRRELPGPQIVVILELGPPIRIFDPGSEQGGARYVGGFVAGMSDTFSLTEHGGVQRGIQLNLTPIGARLFFGVSMSELTGRAVSLRDLLPREHRSLAERLEALPSWDARFELLERVLTGLLAEASLQSTVVSWACRRIEERCGAVDIGALAREMGYSQKHVIELFREHVGVPPKLLARIVRFDRLIQHLKGGASGTWAGFAQEFGYYDQAHLVRDVKQFTGTTPTRARAELTDLTALSEP